MTESKETRPVAGDQDELENPAENETVETGDPTAETTGETEKLSAEIAELRDKFLRTYSEFENYKKRTHRERMELFKTANSETILALLPVLDDFDRALKSIEAAESTESLKEGVELIYHKLKSILEQKGLVRMNSVGELFNVDQHEAITSIPVEDEKQKGIVIEEAESGYFLNGKVIRHAKVIVGN